MPYNSARNENPSRPLLVPGLEEVLRERQSKTMRREALRSTSLVWSIGSALCAGSIATFSLYAPSLASHLHYSQLQINSIAISAALSGYLPVSAFGYICDTYSPRPVSLLSALFFCSGYTLAALVYSAGPDGYPFWCMLLAFVLIGAGTCSMFLGAIATVTKNYGRSNRRGIMMALPIAAFGLSGMWESQVGMHFLYERGENGLSQGNVDPIKYFVFLSVLLTIVGLGGTAMLTVVAEDEPIEEAMEEIERTGLLSQRPHGEEEEDENSSYGSIYTHDHGIDALDDEQERKHWLLDYETRKFLSDKTMWLLCACFLLVSGPGEAYINNIGTIIQTTSSPASSSSVPPAGPASTYVSTVAVTSTLARLVTGYLSDTFGPSATKPQSFSNRKLILSRPLLLSFTTCFMFTAFALLSMPSLISTRPETILLLTTAMVGIGYGAVFTLTPIIVAIVWRVENFGTNWGLIMISPAVGATLSSAHFSYVFDGACDSDGRCFGWECYGAWVFGGALNLGIAIILFAITWYCWKERNVTV